MQHRDKCNYSILITESELKNMLDLCLDYSFVQYRNNYFYQHRGIQMGGAASVSIANITVFEELKSIFQNSTEFVFCKRFLDDIFGIIDITNLENLDSWVENKLSHPFLKFTFETNVTSINFLDLVIQLSDSNVISTKLYKKPMSKSQPLLYISNHRKCLLNSIPYAQGLRVIRSCTFDYDIEREISDLMCKFKNRLYPQKVLNDVLIKLNTIDRNVLLTPRKPLLINNLRIHHPEILNDLGIQIEFNSNNDNFNQNIYFVMPYFNSINNYASLIKQFVYN